MEEKYLVKYQGCFPIFIRFVGLGLLLWIFFFESCFLLSGLLFQKDFLSSHIIDLGYFLLKFAIMVPLGLFMANLFPTIAFENTGITLIRMWIPMRKFISWDKIPKLTKFEKGILNGNFGIIISDEENNKTTLHLVIENILGRVLGYSRPVILLSSKSLILAKILSMEQVQERMDEFLE